jgi:phage shock protein PspC (stress-responsive transcriptional regulator)
MNSFTDEPQAAADNETTADHETAGDPMDASSQPAASQPSRPIRRPVRGRMLAGVAAGIAQHFGIDVTIVRVVFAVLTIVGFTGLAYLGGAPLYLGGIPLYLACWLLIPEEGSDHSIASAALHNAQRRSR